MKKNVIFYGNCHMEVVQEILSKYTPFTERFEICPIKPIYQVKDASYFESPVFKACDVFIHQDIQEKNRYGPEFASENIIKKLKPGCSVLAVPNVYHLPKCFFPQYSEKNELRTRRGNTVFFRDSVIDECFLKHMSVQEIEREYRTVSLIDEEEQSDQFCTFIEKVRNREKTWDIPVSDFILNNYKTYRLFNDPNHPTVYFLKYIAAEIANKLLKDVDKEAIEKIHCSLLDPYEMPIMACTKNNMFLVFQQDTVRRTGQKIRHRDMDLKEYILQYLSMEWSNPDMDKGSRIRSRFIWVRLKITDFPYVCKKISGKIRKIVFKH